MVRQVTLDKLHDMRLSAMADAFEAQCNDQSYDSFGFDDRLGMLVDKEWDKRINSKLDSYCSLSIPKCLHGRY